MKYITEEVYRELFPSGSTPGILYGLPKVHKPDWPARPILSAIGTCNYNNVLVQILLYGDKDFSINVNKNVLKLTLNFIHKTGRFN